MQDEKVFDDIVAQLRSTNKFRWVDWGWKDADVPTDGATVLIKRTFFDRDVRVGDSEGEERRINFQVILTYFNTDTNARRRRMLNYEALIINLIHHQRLGGLTMPMKTGIDKATDDDKQPSGVSKTVMIAYATYRIAQVNALTVEEI